MEHIYDLVIIGSGPAGLAAAVYAQRARLDTLVIEKAMVSGGQVLTTYEVDNYPGVQGIGGYDLGMKFREHADSLGAEFVEDEVVRVETDGAGKKVVCTGNTYETKTVIIATGASHRKLGVPGEEELAGMGVSYCATCDGAFFRGKTTAVIGGGDVAIEDAIFLARLCKKVYVVHRRDGLFISRLSRHGKGKFPCFSAIAPVWIPFTAVRSPCLALSFSAGGSRPAVSLAKLHFFTIQ